MKLRSTPFKISLWLACIIGPLLWLATTTAGLRMGLAIASIFSPVQFYYGQVDGKLIGQPIKIKDLNIDYQGKKLSISRLTLDWQFGTLNATKVQGLDKFFPHAALVKYQEITLDHIYAHLVRKDNNLLINMQTSGQSAQSKLLGNISLEKVDQDWDVKYALLKIGANNIDLKQNKPNQYKLHLNLTAPQVLFKHSSGSILAQAEINNSQATPTLHATVKSKSFKLNDYEVTNLQGALNLVLQPSVPLVANITADKVNITGQHFTELRIKLAGDIANHTISGKTIYNKEQLILNTNASLKHKIWTAHKITLGYNKEQLNGQGYYDFASNAGNIKMNGRIFSIATDATLVAQDPQNITLALQMHASAQNNLNANIKLTQNQLSGNVRVVADDLAFLMQWMPDVTRLKGNFTANVNIAGTIAAPQITSTTHLSNITATIPSWGVKIKPMEVHVLGDKSGKFTVYGSGKMRRGTGDLQLSGYIEPFKDNMPNEFTIVGNNVEFVNNQMAHLTASNKFNIHYALNERRLDITGDIEVHKGTITIPDKRDQTVKSKDVVFVHETDPNQAKNMIIVNPNINLRIAEGVHFNGFGLDADVTGKLNISHRHNALYADGRITIKEGSYRIPGQRLVINHGRLLYPPGTLLANPMLDIKMIGKRPSIMAKESDSSPYLELTVQGTAQKPVISESGLANNQDRALSQAMLTGSSVISNNILHDKLKISELGVTSHSNGDIEFFDDPKDKSSFKNKDFVIGRPLGSKLYLQYLHNLGEANNRIRLKYALNKTWSIGLESGTQGGGADLSFNIERD